MQTSRLADANCRCLAAEGGPADPACQEWRGIMRSTLNRYRRTAITLSLTAVVVLTLAAVNGAEPKPNVPALGAKQQGLRIDPNILSQLLQLGVLYQSWGPGPAQSRISPTVISRLRVHAEPSGRAAERYVNAPDERRLRAVGPSSGAQIAEQLAALSTQSPVPAAKFVPGVEGVDAGIAVGNQYIIVAHDHQIAFFDKSGNALTGKDGFATNLSATAFFGGFLAPTKADGSINYDNINRYLNFPADAPIKPDPDASPPTFPCVDEFYDTRVLFDPGSKRFFILSAARHQLWPDDPKTNPGGQYNALVRRYVAFAVSRTEDPRDGFHQYMLTESNYRDWPRMSVNGNVFVVAHNAEGAADSYVAYVFALDALKTGNQKALRFRLTQTDLGVPAVVPVTHFASPDGLTFLLRPDGATITIIAFPQPGASFKKPAVMKASVTLAEAPSMLRTGAIYRNGKIYFACVKKVQDGPPERYSVRVVRIPIQVSANGISASTSGAQGYLDWAFGKNAVEDAPTDLVSYELPSMAVNQAGDMLFGYGRSPVQTQKPLLPEARYTLWYAAEAKQRRSRQLQPGGYQPVKDGAKINFYAADFTSTVVDPADDRTFWTALFYGDPSRPGAFKTVIGKVVP